jgi:hypothetical protein
MFSRLAVPDIVTTIRPHAAAAVISHWPADFSLSGRFFTVRPIFHCPEDQFTTRLYALVVPSPVAKFHPVKAVYAGRND